MQEEDDADAWTKRSQLDLGALTVSAGPNEQALDHNLGLAQ